MGGRRANDQGQAFPIYVVVVTGLLFAAFVFFAVGQAAVRRSDAQGAADAAALAAAREARDGALANLDLVTLKPADWEKLLKGNLLTGKGACAAATDFAAKNDAAAACQPSIPRITVTVTTNATVGKSVVPGTDGMHGTASATALIEPRCELGAVPAPSATPQPSGGSTPKPTPAPTADPITLLCKGGKPIQIDPLNPGSLRTLSRSLFSVRLVD
ncbi:pilus assembly protein TadG-related protein [Streptomyces sp. NBC_00047]|uniref:pilus assembly protein TadG-related protein n=1 Tax=Streptomyces sp. NBC_00047 TaxID=2975627 RepID=UPI00225B56C2|nr:pilus assembly protein TadG-related protein [Streptomyces sp. NBC_00047]MCX5605999.1 pilus assembly protein TadG-related protein [Streptomyces sp. NBC_00047]